MCGGRGDIGVRDEEAAGHAEVDEELGGCWGGAAPCSLSRRAGTFEGDNDGFADAADLGDGGAGEDVGDLGFGGLEGLGLTAGPDGRDALAANAVVDAVGDGFNLGELRHAACRRRR